MEALPTLISCRPFLTVEKVDVKSDDPTDDTVKADVDTSPSPSSYVTTKEPSDFASTVDPNMYLTNELPSASNASLTFDATVAAESPAANATFTPETVIVPAAETAEKESCCISLVLT